MPPKRKRNEDEDSTDSTINSARDEGNARLIKKLKSPDFVLSLSAQNTARQYMENNTNIATETNIKQIKSMLSNNYKGLPYHRNALFFIGAYVAAKKDALQLQGQETPEVIREMKKDKLQEKKFEIEKKLLKTLSELIEKHFDSDKIMSFKESNGGSNFNEQYLDTMCNDGSYWRPFLIKLAGDPKHRNTKFMNHVVQKLSQKGFHFDVIKQAKTNDYYSAFNQVIYEILNEVPITNSAYWKNILKPYGKLLTREPYSVLYTDTLLRRLTKVTMLQGTLSNNDNNGGSSSINSNHINHGASYRFQRVAQEFRRCASEFDRHVDDPGEFKKKQEVLRRIFIDNLIVTNALSTDDDKEFLAKIEEILKSYDEVLLSRVTESHLSAPNYTNPKLVESILKKHLEKTKYIKILQNPEFFDIFITDIFHPYHPCDEHRESLCKIIAVLSSNNNKEKVGNIERKLHLSSELCNNPDNLSASYQEVDLFDKLWKYADNVPCVGAGILKWIRVAWTSRRYWTQGEKKTDEQVQGILNLMESIGKKEALLAPEVVNILQGVMKLQETVGSNSSLTHKKMQMFLKKIVDAMVYGDAIIIMTFLSTLVEINPVTKRPKLEVEQIQWLVKCIIGIASAPFSKLFSMACWYFFYKKKVLQSCYGPQVDKGVLKKFFHECFKTLEPIQIEKVKKVYSKIVAF
jgi:hypothetical protein